MFGTVAHVYPNDQSKSILGHASTAYQVGAKVLSFAFCVDFIQTTETGVCLSRHTAASLDDNVASDVDGDFTCTRFDFAYVHLPGTAELSVR